MVAARSRMKHADSAAHSSGRKGGDSRVFEKPAMGVLQMMPMATDPTGHTSVVSCCEWDGIPLPVSFARRSARVTPVTETCFEGPLFRRSDFFHRRRNDRPGFDEHIVREPL